MNHPLSGLIAAPFTPFNSHGELALDVVPALASSLLANGVLGAFVCGTTGEGFSLTKEERFQVVEAWQEARSSDLALIVHVGSQSLEESLELAHHAQESGADAIATIAPSFYKPTGVDDLVEWCARIAAAAPRLPFYYYHMPAMTGVPVSATDFIGHAHNRIPTLAGVKFTDEDLMDFAQARRTAAGKYEILFGRDEILLAGLSLGAHCAVGSTYNFAAPLFQRILRNFADGNLTEARHDQYKAIQYIRILQDHGGLSAGKAVMKMLGIDCGPVRLPLSKLSASREQALFAALKRSDFSADLQVA
ncbi:MAG: dihydrodipicolinate synthase family protein [Opitutaceae bacterium]|nr:dihydrodipicolinate synthase family protein [Cephaloticoccus sp.]MCP5530444.1 dihydrodipicolinate synthase family protein [Opitutaceae bacterium]